MTLLLVAALILGLGTMLLGLLAIGRGLFHESIIDAPSMPDTRDPREQAREQAYRSPSTYSSAIPAD
jgi:hypothetical protein